MAPYIVLYTNREYSSPYALSVYATLVEKGLPFRIETVDLAIGQQQQPAYVDVSLTARVPSLIIDGFSLSESSAIIEYLEEAYPAPDYPSVFPLAMQQRARARQIQAWVRSDLGTLREERQTTVIYSHRNPAPLSEQGKRDAGKLLSIANTLIDDDGNNIFGAWSVADVDLSVMLNRLYANGDPVPEKVKKYVDRQSARPCVDEWWKLAKA